MDQSRYIVVEGPIGAGKAALAERLAESLGARAVLEESEANPFLSGFLEDRERFAFQAQLFFLLSRFRRQQELTQLNLFHRGMVADHLFERDRIFALVNLNEEEFALYDQVFSLLHDRVLHPDLVVYLSARSEALWKRVKAAGGEGTWYTLEYIQELCEAYNYFFLHYDRSALLVVNTSDVDFIQDGENYRHLLHEIKTHRKGVKHYIPRGAPESAFSRGL